MGSGLRYVVLSAAISLSVLAPAKDNEGSRSPYKRLERRFLAKDKYKKAIRKAERIFKRDSSIEGRMFLAEAYYLQGSVVKHAEFTSQLSRTSELHRDSLSSAQKDKLFEIFMQSGRYHDASKLTSDIDSLDQQVRQHAVFVYLGYFRDAEEMEANMYSRFTSVVEDKSLKKKIRKRFEFLHGQFTLQVASRLQNQGLFDSAQAYLALAKSQFHRLKKNKDLCAQYFELLGDVSLAQDELYRAQNFYKSSLAIFTKEHKFHHPYSVNLISKILDAYFLDGEDRIVRELIKLYYPKLKYYDHDKSSLNTSPLLLAELDRDLSDGRYRQADKLAAKLKVLADAYKDVYSPRVYELTESLLNYYTQRSRYAVSESFVQNVEKFGHIRFGLESPAHAYTSLKVASFRTLFFYQKDQLPLFESANTWGLYADNYGVKHSAYFDLLEAKALSYQLNTRLDDQMALYVKSVEEADAAYGRGAQWIQQNMRMADAWLYRGSFGPINAILDTVAPALDKMKGRRNILYLTASRIQAEVYENTGKLDEAEKIYRKTFRGLARLDRKSGGSQFQQPEKMSKVQLLSGNLDAAEDQLNQAISQKLQLYGDRNPGILIDPYALLARVAFLRGDVIGAQRHAQTALEYGTKSGLEKSLAIQQTIKLLAEIDFALGDYASSAERHRDILKQQEKSLGRNNPITAGTLLRLGLSQFFDGEDALNNEKLVEEACQTFEQNLGPNSIQLADALCYAAMFRMNSGDFAKAMEELNRAEKISVSQFGNKSREQARILCLKGDASMGLDSSAWAENFYLKSAAMYKKFNGPHHPEYLKTQSRLAKLRLKQGKSKQAMSMIKKVLKEHQEFIDKIYPFLTDREKGKYWNILSPDYDLYYNLIDAVASSNQKELKLALETRVNTKALLLRSTVDFQREVRRSSVPEVKNTFDDWLAGKKELASYFGIPQEELLKQNINIKAIESEVNGLEKKLRNLVYKNEKKKTKNNLLTALNDSEILVDVLRYASATKPGEIRYAYIVADGKSKKINWLSQGGGRQMENEFFRYYRNAVKLNASDRYSYHVYWEPIDSLIDDNKKIIFSPDGVYGLINPEMILDDEGRYLLEKNTLRWVSNPGDISRRTETDTLRLSYAELVGNPSFYSEEPKGKKLVKDLPGTAVEIEKLNSIFNQTGLRTKTFEGLSACEDSIKQLHSPSLVHIATHGYFEDEDDPFVLASLSEEKAAKNPLLQSGLILSHGGEIFNQELNKYTSDGLLTALEAKDLNLSQTKLVVLSACETGLGKVSNGNGVLGLQRAFLDAGAGSVIMSLFKVDDEVTAELMEQFYSRWMQSGNKEQSLSDAKKAIKNKYPDPIKWGSFVMIGD